MTISDKQTNKQPNYSILAQKTGPETLTPKNINVIPIFPFLGIVQYEKKWALTQPVKIATCIGPI